MSGGGGEKKEKKNPSSFVTDDLASEKKQKKRAVCKTHTKLEKKGTKMVTHMFLYCSGMSFGN